MTWQSKCASVFLFFNVFVKKIPFIHSIVIVNRMYYYLQIPVTQMYK